MHSANVNTTRLVSPHGSLFGIRSLEPQEASQPNAAVACIVLAMLSAAVLHRFFKDSGIIIRMLHHIPPGLRSTRLRWRVLYPQTYPQCTHGKEKWGKMGENGGGNGGKWGKMGGEWGKMGENGEN